MNSIFDLIQSITHKEGNQTMRKIENPQIRLGAIPIADIDLDLSSRDDITALLKGLQYMYTNSSIRDDVFRILETIVPKDINPNDGRPGMNLWSILVLGTLRLCLNADYDRIHDLSNNHHAIRSMLGHGIFDFEEKYSLQRIKDNVSLLTVEILNQINTLVVKAGHKYISPLEEVVLKGKADSFVVETNVHYPTDINLLWDAMRKSIDIVSQFCKKYEIPNWNGSAISQEIKKLFRKAQKSKRSKAKSDEKKNNIIATHQKYMESAAFYISSINIAMQFLRSKGVSEDSFEELNKYLVHAIRQIKQIQDRVVKGVVIPQDEKCFSVFEEYTEWIVKGKAGILQELGVRVCILEDQFGFILHHRVMQKITDEKIAVPIVVETKETFNTLNQVSFDKGFYSPQNQSELNKILDHVILPKKGRMTKQEEKWQTSDEFCEARKKHSGVESAINALEVHGLDRCPDRGLVNFEKYIALAVLGRNLHRLGSIIIKKERERNKHAA